MNRFDNIDCMIGMKEYPDKYFDLAIVDPPYGIGFSDFIGDGKVQFVNGGYVQSKRKENKKWDSDSPSKDYFKELFRISRNQILFGANHYISKIPFDSSGWIVWNKKNGKSPFSDCELAWSSFDVPCRMFEYLWCGMIQQQQDKRLAEPRIHPTQKPIALYKWLLTKYAKPNDKILDTHVGSASSLIACEDLGFEYVGFELDEDYYKAANKRLEQFRAQLKLAI